MFKRIYWGMAIICAFWIGLEIWPWLVQNPPNEISLFDRLTDPSATHWFGTDELGRDMCISINLVMKFVRGSEWT